jgi:hypothetical protein
LPGFMAGTRPPGPFGATSGFAGATLWADFDSGFLDMYSSTACKPLRVGEWKQP